jgi:hypothetical protein
MERVCVEGFGTSASLKGQRIFFVKDQPLPLNKQYALEQELIGREKGQRILILANKRKNILKWGNTVEWDMVFKVGDAVDLRVALTYIARSSSLVRLVWLGDEPNLTISSKRVYHYSRHIGYEVCIRIMSGIIFSFRDH